MCATARHPRCPRPRRPARPGPVLALLALLCGPALAAPPPDAGQVQRQAERALDAKPAPPPATEVPEAPEDVDAGPGFGVREFRHEGVTLRPQELLQEALEPWRGKPIHFPGLQAALRRIVATYRQHGWFARADLPEQDITDGVVVVQVLEGRFGRLGVLDDGTRANGGFLARMVGRGGAVARTPAARREPAGGVGPAGCGGAAGPRARGRALAPGRSGPRTGRAPGAAAAGRLRLREPRRARPAGYR